MNDTMVILLKGGISAEREVSLWTAATIAESLQRQNIPCNEIDAQDPNWLQRVEALQPAPVIIALHGPFGEDGTVQALLEERGIPFTGSSAAVAALTINKAATKERVAAAGVHVPQSQTATELVEWKGSYPVVVKPNHQGSSFGTTIVHKPQHLAHSIETALIYDQEILLEEYIAGTEVTCGVIDLFGHVQALPLVEIRPKQGFFDFAAKYTPGECQEICPAEVSENVTKAVQTSSEHIFRLLGIRHYARIDWIVKKGVPYFLEINTLPGMTKTSLITKELAAATIAFDQFITALLAATKKPLR